MTYKKPIFGLLVKKFHAPYGIIRLPRLKDTLISCFIIIHFYSVLRSTLVFPKLSPYFRFLIKILCVYIISPMRATCLPHLILLDFITVMISGEKYKL